MLSDAQVLTKTQHALSHTEEEDAQRYKVRQKEEIKTGLNSKHIQNIVLDILFMYRQITVLF